MRILGIDYGESRVGLAISDSLGITAQGLETVHYKGNDKILLKRLDETVDERLTTVQAHRTMNDLQINPKKKKSLVDTISAVYILEIYMNK